ncbi:MAG: cupin domain-containing protein [Phaeodactylibacter sp.]|nr:cupin domain-containing protein [Phaeodactylibacter sp.]MCB9275137.1 cupin domain-containing protein [Lewinellaceae bacterium]
MKNLPYSIENHLGEKLVFKAAVMEDGEEKVIVENFVQPGAGPVMHVHFKQDESLTVLSGKMGYQVLGEEERFAGPGETVRFNRGVPHRFWNAGEDILNCEGWVKPANSFIYFLTALYNAIDKSGKEAPEAFDGAYLVTRYRTEYDLPGIPVFVKRVIMPITVAIGKLLGKYKHFNDAPAPLR